MTTTPRSAKQICDDLEQLIPRPTATIAKAVAFITAQDVEIERLTLEKWELTRQAQEGDAAKIGFEGERIRAEAAEASLAAVTAERDAMKSEAVVWQNGATTPAVKPGHMTTVIVAVRRAHNGKIYSFPGSYLNSYRLDYEDGCVCPSDKQHTDDGCPTTGWFADRFHPDYSNYFEKLLEKGDDLISWSEIQKFEVLGNPHPTAESSLATVKAERDAMRAALLEAVIRVENDRTLWTPEWQVWQLSARAALSLDAQVKGKHCRPCGSERKGDTCWKCGSELFVVADGWEEPSIPPIDPIRKSAREVGYAIGVHGSQERDLDLIAAPWTDEALDAEDLLRHIAQGINARVVSTEQKPLGRFSATLQIDGWFKNIDISVCPRLTHDAQGEK